MSVQEQMNLLNEMFSEQQYSSALKGQCEEIFYFNNCAQKTLSGPHMNRLKRFCELFCLRQDIRIQSLSSRA